LAAQIMMADEKLARMKGEGPPSCGKWCIWAKPTRPNASASSTGWRRFPATSKPSAWFS